MAKFSFIPFSNKNSWQENLSVFIYIEAIINRKKRTEIILSNYKKVEFWDNDIKSYQEWLLKKGNSLKIIEEFYSENSSLIDEFSENFGTDYQPKVILWKDRKKNEYFKQQLQESFQFENFIAKKISDEYDLDIEPFLTPEGQYELGENALGIEIKYDKRLADTGNIYIEFQEKSQESNKTFVNSGILKEDNTIYFLIGHYNEYHIIKKDRLLVIFEEEKKHIENKTKSLRCIRFVEIGTSKGYVYPVKKAKQDIISFENMMKEIINDLESNGKA